MNEWINISKKMPDVHVNDCGVKTTDLIVFRSDFTKTVHLGYAIVKTAYLQGCSTDIWNFYDQAGNVIDDVSQWCETPKSEEITVDSKMLKLSVINALEKSDDFKGSYAKTFRLAEAIANEIISDKNHIFRGDGK